WEEIFFPDGGIPDAGGPRGGFFQPCSVAGPFSNCRRFAWASVDGGDPAQFAPHLVPATDGGALQVQVQIGTLVFGPSAYKNCTDPDGGICPNREYFLYAIISTDDPYTPTVLDEIKAVAAP